jgi:hypothetical protein
MVRPVSELPLVPLLPEPASLSQPISDNPPTASTAAIDAFTSLLLIMRPPQELTSRLDAAANNGGLQSK